MEILVDRDPEGAWEISPGRLKPSTSRITTPVRLSTAHETVQLPGRTPRITPHVSAIIHSYREGHPTSNRHVAAVPFLVKL